MKETLAFERGKKVVFGASRVRQGQVVGQQWP